MLRPEREQFDKRLSELGYVMTGLAKGPQGHNYSVSVPVGIELWVPFALITIQSKAGSSPPLPIVAGNAEGPLITPPSVPPVGSALSE
jgi:hypothetical protein